MTDYYAVQLDDHDLGNLIWAVARAATPKNSHPDGPAVVAIGVSFGRTIGAKQTLEPLDDA
ncbi:hypothetical protein, partial [Roseisolibacter sp. H3M3-2]|uniref:hypothetical protein n=1 Tax=Roseisolibacter sp. H3M3-2 TaxID=3031323 RepID=UPI0023DB401F